jgi:hypothetical protein
VLVDDWVAAALAPTPLALRITTPLARAPAARELMLGSDVLLVGHPWRQDVPRQLRLAPAWSSRLDELLTAIEIVALPPSAPLPGPARTVLRVDDTVLTSDGACDDLGHQLLVRSSLGDGCVDAAAWSRAVAWVEQAAGDATAALVDLRPAAVDATRIQLRDGATLDRRGRPMIDGRPADPDRVAELVTALAAPAQLVALPKTTATATMAVTARDGETIALDLYADRVLARHGESVALALTPAAWASLTPASAELLDTTRWAEEPTTIASIAVDGAVFARGAVIGEWTGGGDGELLEALASALAIVRAPSGPPPQAVEHRVELRVTPPAGASVTHHVDVGTVTAHGCAARVDDTAVVLPLATCTAVVAVSAARASRSPPR